MEKVQLFKFNKISFCFLLGVAIFFFLIGAVYAINAIINGFKFGFPGDWMSVIFIFQGIIFGLMMLVGKLDFSSNVMRRNLSI